MAIKTYNGTAFADATAKYYNGSAWVEPNSGVKRWSGSAWEVVSTAFEATTAPTQLYGNVTYNDIRQLYVGQSSSPNNGYATVTVTGGGQNIAYLWQYVSGTTAAINLSAVTPFASSTVFSYNNDLQVGNAVYRCRVTDTDSGNVIYTNTVTVSFS